MQKNPVPIMIMADIINGYRVVFPASIAQGCSFNPELAEKIGKITAYESAKNGINVTFSPMVDVSRDPRWGRVTEGYGEDSLINSDFAAATVKGYQGESLADDDTICACVKHFAAYGATRDGRDYNSVEMSERMLREDYLSPYKAAIDAGAGMIMPAFNTINGIPCTINKFLLNDILREEWGFDGVTISDYGAILGCFNEGACNSKEQTAQLALECGVDIDMVDPIYSENLETALEKGLVSEEMIDKSVMRILKIKNELGILDDPYKYIKQDSDPQALNSEQHKDFTIDCVCQSSVLLKNDNILPLSKEESVAFIGPYTKVNELLTRWSMVTPHRDAGISIETALDNIFGNKKFKCYAGSPFMKKEEDTLIRRYLDEGWGKEDELIEQAVDVAKSEKTVVLALGEHVNQFGEAHSRSNIQINDVQKSLFDAVYEVNQNIVVVLFCGRPLEITEISQKAKAVLNVWFPRTYGAEAIVDMLFGDRVPSGKLSMCFPKSVGQLPIYYETLPISHHCEEGGRKANYGCRYIDVDNYPLYSFGHGLSYTEFAYSNLRISNEKMTRNDKLTVSVDVENSGDFDAYETVQLYIHDVKATLVSRPMKQLKAYKKVFICKGEKTTVSFEIDETMLKYYDYNMNHISENGMFEAYVGTSSDTRQHIDFELV